MNLFSAGEYLDMVSVHAQCGYDTGRCIELCLRWIPRNSTEAQKTDRVTWCNAMLTGLKEGASHLVWGIVTGDETWIYCYDPKTK
ncbi:hypothetical protein EVAR_70280_1 [Eumeta japonica]|uniref:Mariner Mos1 transposase n=1 Tax=Eumeta variegata TaxID=151549 RepID=A0A4C2ADJ8_EUMVA|nr:hypothetical protein EVAR_70280_1 [Eumeta japonica]